MPSAITRRQLLLSTSAMGLGLLAGCGRLPWQAQSDTRPPTRIRRLGLLTSPQTPYEDEFRQALHDLGYIEGQNLIVETRYEQSRLGSLEEFTTLTTELIQFPVDAIATIGSRATAAARAVTTTIPIVQIWGVGDLIELRLVASFARPGGNVTGMTNITTDLVGKWLQLLKDAVPATSHVAMLTFFRPASPAYASVEAEARAAAQALGIEVTLLPAGTDSELDVALETIARGDFNGLMATMGVVMNRRRQQLVDLTIERRLPAITDYRQFTVLGSLMSYAGSNSDNARRAAALVDKVLRGTSPAEIPVERPMRFDFVVNLKTARELGITFPNEILLQVTEVIE
jgi:putative tryptophan/tyrosine transport system substrate-binding protein